MKVKSLRRAGSAILAAAIALNCSAVGSMLAAAAGNKYEFEDSSCTSYSSDIIVESTGLYMEGSGTITMTVNVETAGTYDLIFYAYGVGGSKQQGLSVNGTSVGTLNITAGTDYVPCEVSAVKLQAGENVIEITKSWGWSKFDCLVIEETVLPDIGASDITLCDPDVIPEAQKLMNYMASVYGTNIISGQQEIYQYGPHDYEYEFNYLQDLTGEMPAIRGFDYGNFTCPAFGADDGSTDRIIDWVKNKNGIATSSWHINVPNDIDSYTIGSRIDWSQTSYSAKDNNFSPKNAYTEGTKEYEYYLQALETLATEFNELEEQGIPVIWRPLHEAEGGGGETGSWFWWGKEGSTVYKELWKYTYDVLTNDFGCHNLIWEWNSYNFETSGNWYPGDEYVDIIGYDKYSCTDWSTGSAVLTHNDSSFASTFYGIMERYGSAKMVAMAENDSFSTVDNLINDKAGWLYFCTWYDGGSADINFLSDPMFNTKQDTIDMYQSEYCITLDELPADLYSNEITATTITTGTTTTVTTPDPDKYVFEQFTQAVDVTKDGIEGETLTITIKGEPTASIGGGLCYTDSTGEWTYIEWSGNADKDGNLVCVIDLGQVDASADSTFEVAVWWSNVWDNATESATDFPCELVSVVESGSEGTTTTTTTTSDGETTTTTTTTVDPDFVFEVVKYPVELPEGSKEGKIISFELEGSANASVGGGLCFNGADGEWTNVEWSGNLDADGKGTFEVSLTDVPDSEVSAEVQIWWSNVWDAVNEVGIDKPCEMVSYEVFGQGAELEIIYGDADLDGEVKMSDVIKVMCYASNKQAYPLDEEALNNCDVYQRGDGVDTSDALSIQKKVAQLIETLPESVIE